MTTLSNIDLLLRSIRMVDLLAHFGKRVDHVGYMYYSPFRDEDSPSMRIKNRNGLDIWVDYGADLTDADRASGKKFHGGGLIDMAMELGGLSKREAIDLLKELRPAEAMMMDIQHTPPAPVRKEDEGSVVIESVSETFSNRRLISYSENERRIPRDVLSRYCREVRYHVRSNPSRSFVKIGFPNNEGGWTLRGSRGKISSASGITTFDASGSHTPEPSTSRAFVFEGFFDFLSWVVWNGAGGQKVDACVLNSVSNLSRAVNWISAHKEVAVCFDNDQAGRKALANLREWCPDCRVHDCSETYREYNDLNDFFVDRCRRRQGECRSESQEPPSKGMKL